MGVFRDVKLEEAASDKFDPLNPNSVYFSDGTPILTENDITTVLQFRRDFETAQ